MKAEDKQALIGRIKEIKRTGKANRFELTEIAEIALASLEAEPAAWWHRLVNKHNGVIHPWVYGSAEAEESEGDVFRIEVMRLYTAPPVPEDRNPVVLPDMEEDELAFNAGVNALIDCLEDCGDAEQGLRLALRAIRAADYPVEGE